MIGYDSAFLPLGPGGQPGSESIRMAAEPRLLAAARRTARAAVALLRAIEAPMLTVVRDLSCEPMRIRILPWSVGLVPGEELDTLTAGADADLRQLIAPLAFCGAETCRLLSLRWPANAMPPVISIMTDGTGVAMSPGGRPPLPGGAPLAARSRTKVRTSVILPFHATGAWAVLSSPEIMGAVH